MAVFVHLRAFEGASPVSFRPEWGGGPPAMQTRVVASWALGPDGRPVRRWRLVASSCA
jgi:hypothetical protein